VTTNTHTLARYPQIRHLNGSNSDTTPCDRIVRALLRVLSSNLTASSVAVVLVKSVQEADTQAQGLLAWLKRIGMPSDCVFFYTRDADAYTRGLSPRHYHSELTRAAAVLSPGKVGRVAHLASTRAAHHNAYMLPTDPARPGTRRSNCHIRVATQRRIGFMMSVFLVATLSGFDYLPRPIVHGLGDARASALMLQYTSVSRVAHAGVSEARQVRFRSAATRWLVSR
jgi:hypothetical protein